MAGLIRRPKVGLALGGGGARGLAHIGVLKVLEAAHIPIDCLAGTSMGGILAAAYAAGVLPSEMEAEALRVAQPHQLMRLLDIFPLRRDLLEGKTLRQFLHKRLGERSFAQLQRPTALVAVDFVRGETCFLSEGKVLDAVMATCAVPGLFPPVEIDGRVLVDGGLLDNVPADAARALGAEVVIAVDVAPPFPRQLSPDDDASRYGLPLPFPQLTGDLYQALLIMTSAIVSTRLQEAQPTVVIRPEMPDEIGIFLGFPHARQAIQAGEDATRQLLSDIREAVKPSLRLNLPWAKHRA